MSGVMIKNEEIQLHTNRRLKQEAEKISKANGMELEEYVNLILLKTVQNKQIPIEISEEETTDLMIQKLEKNLAESYKDIEEGRVYSHKEIKAIYGK